MERVTPGECIPAMGASEVRSKNSSCSLFAVHPLGTCGHLRGVHFRSMRVLWIPWQNTFQNEVVSLRSFHLAGARCCFLS